MSRRDWPLLQRSRKAAELQVDGARVEVIGELAVAVILAISRTGFSALVIKNANVPLRAVASPSCRHGRDHIYAYLKSGRPVLFAVVAGKWFCHLLNSLS
jgi:hypothetical protein